MSLDFAVLGRKRGSGKDGFAGRGFAPSTRHRNGCSRAHALRGLRRLL